jgi:hypothetical protein
MPKPGAIKLPVFILTKGKTILLSEKGKIQPPQAKKCRKNSLFAPKCTTWLASFLNK